MTGEREASPERFPFAKVKAHEKKIYAKSHAKSSSLASVINRICINRGSKISRKNKYKDLAWCKTNFASALCFTNLA